MAKNAKKGNGIAAKPPKPNKNNKKQAKGGGNKRFDGLTKNQSKQINQRQKQDLALTNQAGQMLPAIQDSLAQPFNYDQYQGPAEGDYKGWIDEQMGSYNKAFDDRMSPVFSQELEDFEQRMADTGNAPGSPLYERELKNLRQAQNDARSQAYAMNQSMASESAKNFFGIGQSAQDRALGLGQAARYAPLNEYNQLNAAQSGMMNSNLGYTQARGLAEQGGQIARSMPRGGGGGAPPVWSQYGFSSPMEYDAYKTQQSRDQAMWAWANDPQYQKKSGGVSPWAALGGQILGAGVQGWGASGFEKFW